MSAKGYTTEADIENYMLTDIDPSFATQLDGWITSVEKIIEQITGRVFIADATASARFFSGSGERALIIDDAAVITLVEAGQDDYGGTFMTIPSSGATRYFAEPANATAEKVPVTRLLLNGSVWTEGIQNHRVTAKWGFSLAVPDDIKMAATIFVAGIINQNSNTGSDAIKSERIGNYQVTYNSDNGMNSFADFERAIATLDAYKRYYL